MILTTRPPRGHSGSQDHTLSKPWPAGAQTTQSNTGRQPCRHQGSCDWREQTTTNNQAASPNNRQNDQAAEHRERVQRMSAPVSPGPASLEGLRWLCRVGPSPFEAWRCAMGWAPGNARWHTIRLVREGWIERVALPRGDGSLIYATLEGVQVAAVDVAATPAPAPTWWAHLAACAWAAAWLTIRGRAMLGPRELAADQTWHGQLTGLPGRRLVTHVPDLVGIVPGQRPATVEVELTRKTKTRLRAILGLARPVDRRRTGRSLRVRVRQHRDPRPHHQPRQ